MKLPASIKFNSFNDYKLFMENKKHYLLKFNLTEYLNVNKKDVHITDFPIYENHYIINNNIIKTKFNIKVYKLKHFWYCYDRKLKAYKYYTKSFFNNYAWIPTYKNKKDIIYDINRMNDIIDNNLTCKNCAFYKIDNIFGYCDLSVDMLGQHVSKVTKDYKCKLLVKTNEQQTYSKYYLNRFYNKPFVNNILKQIADKVFKNENPKELSNMYHNHIKKYYALCDAGKNTIQYGLNELRKCGKKI